MGLLAEAFVAILVEQQLRAPVESHMHILTCTGTRSVHAPGPPAEAGHNGVQMEPDSYPRADWIGFAREALECTRTEAGA
jgi:hypothetical protein